MAKKSNPRRTTKITIEMLTALEKEKNLSQRILSKELGIALGSTNAYIQKYVAQGWIEKEGLGSKNNYHITVKGLAKKNQFILRRMRGDLNFYAEMKEQFSVLIPTDKSFYIFGTGALAEIAYLAALKKYGKFLDKYFLGFVKLAPVSQTFLGEPVNALQSIQTEASFVFTSLDQAGKMYQSLQSYKKERHNSVTILTPPMLEKLCNNIQ